MSRTSLFPHIINIVLQCMLYCYAMFSINMTDRCFEWEMNVITFYECKFHADRMQCIVRPKTIYACAKKGL